MDCRITGWCRSCSRPALLSLVSTLLQRASKLLIEAVHKLSMTRSELFPCSRKVFGKKIDFFRVRN